MISQTGNNSFFLKYPTRILSKKAFSFIEIMVTLAILSLGMVGIIRVFMVSLDRVEHLTARLYAYNIIENKISFIERMLRGYKTLPFNSDDKEEHTIGAKEITFNHTIKIKAVEDYTNLFQLDLTLDWQEDNKTKQLTRSTYIMDLNLDN